MLKFFTLEQVASLLKVHRTYVSRLVSEEKLKAVKIGRNYRVPESGLFELTQGEFKEIYTADEVAKLLQVHRNSIIKLIKTKKLTALKIGKLYRITNTQLERFLNLSEVK